MRPDRLLIGEVQEAEALNLLIAMNSDLPSMSTIHANSAREAVIKTCTLPLLAEQNISADFVIPTVAGVAAGQCAPCPGPPGYKNARPYESAPGPLFRKTASQLLPNVRPASGIAAKNYPPTPALADKANITQPRFTAAQTTSAFL